MLTVEHPAACTQSINTTHTIHDASSQDPQRPINRREASENMKILMLMFYDIGILLILGNRDTISRVIAAHSSSYNPFLFPAYLIPKAY